MKKKEIVNMFYDEMNPYFEKWGFKFLKSKLEAIKKENYVSKVIYFDATYFLGKASFRPYLSLRNDTIMDIRGEANQEINSDLYPTISKLLPQIASHFKREDLDFLTTDLGEHDLGSYVYYKTMPFYRDNFIKFMEEVGLKFFDMFYTHKDFDKWFNNEIFTGKYDDVAGHLANESIYSYISAVLTDNELSEEIYNYWMNYKLPEKVNKEKLVLLKEYLAKNYKT